MSPRRHADSRDQPFGVLRQQVFIDAGLVVETIEVSGRYQFDQVSVAFLVFAQQHQVVVAVAFSPYFVAAAARRKPRNR